MQVRDLGVRSYAEVWALQSEILSERARDDIPDQLILVEHPNVYTTGRKFQPEHLKSPAPAPVYAVERGGSITFHEPGQLVGYPIFKLSAERRDVLGFLQGLETVLIRTLAHFGFEGQRDARNTGVWINQKKVAAIGIAVRRWVTWHGFSINVHNPLTLLDAIDPCGFGADTVTTLEREATAPHMADLKAQLIQEMKSWWCLD